MSTSLLSFMVRRSSARRQGPKSPRLLALICSLPERIDGPASAGDEGEGVGAATFRSAPRPSTLKRYRTRTRTALMARQDLACSRSPLEMLGYLQPRDFDVHGVAHVRANDLANRGTGYSMTTSDNRARPGCRSRRELTRADLSRHVEGDYGSEGHPRPDPDKAAVAPRIYQGGMPAAKYSSGAAPGRSLGSPNATLPRLNATRRHRRPWFGTKRPQVQILSPRPVFPQVRPRTRIGEGLVCCQYSSKIRQVQQRDEN